MNPGPRAESRETIRYEGKFCLIGARHVHDLSSSGPGSDPAKIKPAKTASAALRLIEQSKSSLRVARRQSGTHNLEKTLVGSGDRPKGPWYIERVKGWRDARHRQRAATPTRFTGRGTYLALESRITLGDLGRGTRRS